VALRQDRGLQWDRGKLLERSHFTLIQVRGEYDPAEESRGHDRRPDELSRTSRENGDTRQATVVQRPPEVRGLVRLHGGVDPPHTTVSADDESRSHPEARRRVAESRLDRRLIAGRNRRAKAEIVGKQLRRILQLVRALQPKPVVNRAAGLQLTLDLSRGRARNQRRECGRDDEHGRREQQGELHREPGTEGAESPHGSIVHRHRDRGRPKANHEIGTALRWRDCLLQRTAGCAKKRMPNSHPPRRVGRIAKGGDSLGIRTGRPGTVGHHDEGAHRVVDIAAQGDDAGPVETNGARLIPGEELQLKPFCGREGIDVVLGRIEVREGHIRADRNDRQERMELQVLL